MRGFIEDLVCVTIIGQVPHLLGIDGTSGNFFTKLWFVRQHLPDASLASVLAGSLSLMAMLSLRHWAPRVPAALEQPEHKPVRDKQRRHDDGRNEVRRPH